MAGLTKPCGFSFFGQMSVMSCNLLPFSNHPQPGRRPSQSPRLRSVANIDLLGVVSDRHEAEQRQLYVNTVASVTAATVALAIISVVSASSVGKPRSVRTTRIQRDHNRNNDHEDDMHGDTRRRSGHCVPHPVDRWYNVQPPPPSSSPSVLG